MDQLQNVNKRSPSGRIMYGVCVAKVTNINDPDKLGRVKCKFVQELNDKEETGWIHVATFMAGKERGAFFLPEVGDEVLLAFDGGNIHKPYVIGCLWSKNGSPPPHKIDGDKNDIRKIKSRANNELIFNDKNGEEGVEIHSAKERKITLDDKDQVILITDKDNKNMIKVESSNGTITIKADKKLILQAGENKIIIDGTANSIQIESKSSIKGKSAQVNLEADGSMTLKSSGMLDVKSDAVVNVKGNMVKIN